MRKIFVFTFFVVSVNVSAQNNSAEDTIAKPAITEAGKANGKIAEMMMNKDGGTLVSGNGKVELIIPSEALSKKTTISIQPITNTIPNGNGQAYRLEPSGIRFQKPAQLVFHYTEEESKDSMQLLMGIAMQDNTGQWYSLKKFELDTVAKTISGYINHFSDWSKFDALKITPDKAGVKVKKSIILEIVGMEPSPVETDEELVKLTRKPKNTEWSVNEIAGGNNSVGKLEFAHSFTIGNRYTAPAQIPAKNPVAVAVKLKGLAVKYNGIAFNDLRLVSNITIYDYAYEVKMIASMKGGDKSSWGGEKTYYDEGSFIVSLDTKTPTILNIENNLETMTDNCEKVILNPGTNTGMIHITAVREIRVHPVHLPDRPDPIVEIAFIQRPAEFTLVKYTCPPPPGYTQGSATGVNILGLGMLQSIPAQPVYLKFFAKDGEQIIVEKGSPGSELYYKFWVRRIKDD